MLPYYESQRGQRPSEGPGKPPPNPVLIVREIGTAVLDYSRWILAIVLIATAAWTTMHFWPEETVRAEMDFTALQDSVIRGGVESVTISGNHIEGTFHGTRDAYDGRIIGIGQPIPDGVYSSADMDQANAFTATIPENARESFIDLLERQGVEVRIE